MPKYSVKVVNGPTVDVHSDSEDNAKTHVTRVFKRNPDDEYSIKESEIESVTKIKD